LAQKLEISKSSGPANFDAGWAMARLGDVRSFRLVMVVALLAAALSIAVVGVAAADDNQTPASAATQQAPATTQPPPAAAPGSSPGSSSGSFPQQPPPAFKPGFLHELGEWWGQSFGDFHTKMNNATDRLDELRKDQSTKDATAATQDALKGAAQAVVRLPSTRMFELHDKCQPAANGAPDCPTAANNACRVKGFSAGKPMGISTSQVCSPAALLSGQSPTAADCHDETYILGVVCQ
jgi:hypothetical protein